MRATIIANASSQIALFDFAGEHSHALPVSRPGPGGSTTLPKVKNWLGKHHIGTVPLWYRTNTTPTRHHTGTGPVSHRCGT